MIAIQKLDVNDIIFLCQLIGYNDIIIFMNKNHISPRKVTGKTLLINKQNSAIQYPAVFGTMYDLSRNDERVISFLESKINTMIVDIVKSLNSKSQSLPEAYFLLSSAINTKFNGNEKLFCKIIEVQDLRQYLEKLNFKSNDGIKEKQEGAEIKMEDAIFVIKPASISLSISRMDRNVITCIIRIIGLNNASKIVPGMWMNKTNEPDEAFLSDYFFKNRQSEKINNFIIKKLKAILEEMYITYNRYNQKYNNSLKAALQVLYESPFKKRPEYYFKITNQFYTSASIKLIKEFLRLPYINFETNDSLESPVISELNKRIQNLDDVIRLRNNESEERKAKYEAQITDLEKSNKEVNEALIAAQAEIEHLIGINEDYKIKAAAKDESTMLLSNKETLITEISHLEDRKDELTDAVKQIEEQKKQLIYQKNQLQKELDDEIKRFSNDFAHSSAIAAIIQQLNNTSNAARCDRSIFNEIPEYSFKSITHEEKCHEVTNILTGNLYSVGIQKNNDDFAKIILSTIICKGNFIVYGSNSAEIADAISLAIFAEYAAHVVLPTDISDIPYFINEINGIQRSIVYIENALDSFSDRLCNSLISHCKDKIFVFAVNDNDSLRSIKGSFAFEKCLYLNTELFTDYLAKCDFKANKCNLSLYQENYDVFNTIIENDYVKQLAKIIGVSPSVYRFWIRIAANYGNKYNIKFRRNIVLEVIASIMIRDNLCNGNIDKLRDFINENDDAKLELLDKVFVEDTENDDDE